MSTEEILKAFDENKVNYDMFYNGPQQVLTDPKLVIRIEDQYYNWTTAAPFIISMLAFKQPLPNEIVGQPLRVIEQPSEEQNVPEIKTEDMEAVGDEGKRQIQVRALENVQALQKKNFKEDSPGGVKSSRKTKVCYQKSLTPTPEQLL